MIAVGKFQIDKLSIFASSCVFNGSRKLIDHILNLYCSGSLDGDRGESKRYLTFCVVDIELSIKKILQLLKELCQRPMRQSKRKVRGIPCRWQCVADNQISIRAITKGCKVVRVTDGIANQLQYIQQIRLEREFVDTAMPTVWPFVGSGHGSINRSIL